MSYQDATQLTVRTGGMGSCQCGDALCQVRADGMIRYTGQEAWQDSEWQDFLREDEPRRPYGSQLSVSEYNETMAELRRLAELRA